MTEFEPELAIQTLPDWSIASAYGVLMDPAVKPGAGDSAAPVEDSSVTDELPELAI